MPYLDIPKYFNWRKFHWTPKHSIYYRVFGEDRSQTVVCLHSNLQNLHDFDYLLEKLIPNYRVIVFDIVGRGKSSWFPDKKYYDYYVYIKDSKYILDKIAKCDVHWIGSSMGGIIGMVLSAKFPSKIKTLILNDIGAEIPVQTVKKMKKYIDLNPEFSNMEEAISYFKIARSKFGIKKQKDWQYITKHSTKVNSTGKYVLQYDPAIISDTALSKKLRKISLWKWWDKIKCPVFLLRGEDSDILTKKLAKSMIASKKDVELLEVKGCGHVPNLFDDSLNNHIFTWLNNKSNN